MPFVLNKSAAKISAAPRGKRKLNPETGRSIVTVPAGKMYDFVPGILVDVEDADLKALVEIPSIKKAFDSGVLIMGNEAKQIGAEVEKELAQPEVAPASPPPAPPIA